MFQFRRFPSYAYFIQHMMNEYCSFGLLHSDICGSMFACNSPQLFAAYHVLLRLLMPRHSPCALISLTILNYALLLLKALLLKKFLLLRFVVNTRLSTFRLSSLKIFCLVVYFLICIYLFSIQFSSCYLFNAFTLMVGTSGLEPPTSRLSGVRSNRLSYAPIIKFLLRKNLKTGEFCLTRSARHFAFANLKTLVFWLLLQRLSVRLYSLCLPVFTFTVCSSSLPLVEMRRIELLTPCVQGRCSPS